MFKMKIIVKKLQGSECSVEVLPTTCILDIKRQVEEKLCIPVGEQKLLLLGRALVDDQTVQSYPSIKDGTKLNLIVKKPDGLYEVSLKHFKKLGMSEIEAKNAASKLIKIVQDKFNKLSWDDIDRLALDCLMDKSGQNHSHVDNDTDSDDILYNL